MKCTKCSSEMEKGYVFAETMTGEAYQWWKKIDENGKPIGAKIEVISFTCVNCGYIEEYLKKN